MSVLQISFHQAIHVSHALPFSNSLETESFENEVFWSQIGFEVTGVSFPFLQKFQ